MNESDRVAPLTRRELDRVSRLLQSTKYDRAMNMEGMDGFFTALICGPGRVGFSDYLPVVFGALPGEHLRFAASAVPPTLRRLLYRHWNSIVHSFESGACHVPVVLDDIDAPLCGKAWAQGFMLGVGLRT